MMFSYGNKNKQFFFLFKYTRATSSLPTVHACMQTPAYGCLPSSYIKSMRT